MTQCDRRQCLVLGLMLAALASAGSAALWAAERPGPPTRALPPPKWSRDVLDAFFDDARQMLVGPRPDYQHDTDTAQARSTSADREAHAASGFAWSKLIDAETIETEVKRLAQAVAGDVASPSEYKGGGYKQCRREFSLLAVLFAVAGQYDRGVRWHDVAPAMRDVFARAGRNSKVGTDATYREAASRKQDLEELVRGGRPQVPPAERGVDWGQVADRPPLMQRLKLAHEDRLTSWLFSEGEFQRRRDEVRHEAQIAAAIANVISQKGFEYWDDEEYAGYARELREAASDAAAAAQRDDYQQAWQAVVRAGQACAKCHEGYRG